MSPIARITTRATLQQVLGPTATQGIAELSLGLGSDGPLGRNNGNFDTHGVQRKSYG